MSTPSWSIASNCSWGDWGFAPSLSCRLRSQVSPPNSRGRSNLGSMYLRMPSTDSMMWPSESIIL